MDNLDELDAATLEEKLKTADSYEDRAAIRKALRDIKKKHGLDVGGAKKRGTSQYNRFAGRPTETKKVSQSFVPNRSPISSTSSPLPPSSARTPSPTSPSNESEREKKEKEEERKRIEKQEREREDREIEERQRQREEKERAREKEREREREEKEREREEREREREDREIEERQRQREEKERAREKEREREREEKEREREEREREREERRRQREIEREEREKEAKEKEEKERERREKERQERKREREEKEEREREERERMREQARKETEKQEEEESGEDAAIENTKNDRKEEEWILVDKKAAQELENQAEESSHNQDNTDGPHKTNVPPSSSSVKSSETEFQKFKLRKTESGEGKGGNTTKSGGGKVNTHDFGVKLKPRPSNEETKSVTQSSWKSSATPPTSRKEVGGGGAPRTLADFQKLANRSKPSDTPTNTSKSQSDKKTLIRCYVNAALEVRPPISSDHALYQLCSKPSNLCKLINKSVRNTVDLRALTKTPPPSASSAEKSEAMEENMILVVESARSIGCSITDDMEQLLAQGDKSTIDKLLIELIRSRVVHMPGMDDEPSSTFNDLSLLMSKLGISPPPEDDQTDQGGEQEEPLTWKEKDSQRLKEKIARDDSEENKHSSNGSSWKEERNKKTPEIDLSKPNFDANLSYEERAALRRAEREKKRREREGYATPK